MVPEMLAERGVEFMLPSIIIPKCRGGFYVGRIANNTLC